jgi:hypothetical protein
MLDLNKKKVLTFDKPKEKSFDVKEYIEKKKNEPVPETIMSKDEKGVITIIKVSSNPEIQE